MAGYLEEKRKIVLAGVTYKKVNQQMQEEIHGLLGSINSLNQQKDYLSNNLLKLIGEFEARELIRIQKTEDHNLYFYLSQQNKVEVVAKVPKHTHLEQHFQEEVEKAGIQSNIGESRHPIGRLDNQLTDYWDRKKMYLDI